MQGEGISVSLVSAADLSAKEHYIIAVDSDGKAALGTSGTTLNIGVLADGGTASGDTVSVQCLGIANVIMSASCNEGAAITGTTGGKGVTTTTDGNRCIGYALEAAAADGDLIRVLLTHFTYNGAA